MDGCSKWTAVSKNVCFAVFGRQKAQNTRSKNVCFPQKVQELYKELCEELFQELYLELYKEPCEEFELDGCFKRVFCSFLAPKSSKHTFFETGPQKWTAVSINVCFAVFGRQKAQNTRSLKQGPRKFRSFIRSSFRSCI